MSQIVIMNLIRRLWKWFCKDIEDPVHKDYIRRHAMADYHDPICVKERELERFIAEEVTKDYAKH